MPDRATEALEFLSGGIPDGDHHKAWIIDQTVRILTGCPTITKKAVGKDGEEYTYLALGESDEYHKFLREYADGQDGPHTYRWDVGVAP